MKTVSQKIILVVLLAGSFFCAEAAGGIIDDPFGYFHVYSLSDIGSASAGYRSDFQGVTGAANNVYFSNFSLDVAHSPTGYSLHTGGNATLSGAYQRNLDIAGNAYLGNVSVNGSVTAGGNISNFAGGNITGNATAAGSVLLNSSVSIQGSSISAAGYEQMVDHGAVSSFFRQSSSDIAAMTATGNVSNQWGHLKYTGSSGINVVNIDTVTLKDAWAFTIEAPSDAVVYINVTDSHVQLDWTDWIYSGGITAADVLLNMAVADSVELTSANFVNILAPNADVIFQNGLITGSLIAGNLQGGGQVNLGHFEHGGTVPEPASIFMLAMGALIFIRRHKSLI